MGNKHATATNQPIKRGRETEPASGPQKFQISTSNNFFQYETGLSGRILNQNPVSTGLRLSYEDDERNSSVTSSSEGMKAFLPGIFSLSDNLKIEIDRQGEEMDHYIRLQVNCFQTLVSSFYISTTTAILFHLGVYRLDFNYRGLCFMSISFCK